MRLHKKEVDIILDSINKVDSSAEVYLIGSRTNNESKGGDIDLLIISETMGLDEKIEFKKNLFMDMDEQKIDVIISKRKDIDKKPFVSYIYKDAIKLIDDRGLN